MYTSVITKAEKATLQEDGSLFLDVEFDIMDAKTVIDTKRLAFAPDTSSQDILDEVKRYTQNFGTEVEAVAANMEENQELAQADATIESIIGQKVTTE